MTDDKLLNKTMEGRNSLHILNIVFKIALSQLNNYIKPNFFIIDELLDSADSITGIDKMKKLVELIKAYYKWVLIISHNTDIKGLYDQRIKIKGTEKERHVYV